MKVSFIFWDLGHETPQLKFFHSLPSLWFCSRSLSSPSRLYFHFCLVCCFSWLPPRFLHRCHFQPLLLLLSLYFIPTCLNWNCSWNYSLAVAPTAFVCHHSSAVVSTLACLFLWWEVLQPLAFATVPRGLWELEAQFSAAQFKKALWLGMRISHILFGLGLGKDHSTKSLMDYRETALTSISYSFKVSHSALDHWGSHELLKF